MVNVGRSETSTGSPKSAASAAKNSFSAAFSGVEPRTLRKSWWIATLSSMTRSRGAPISGCLAMHLSARQFQDEARPASGPLTVCRERATELLGGERTAVQPEPMPGFARRKAMPEEAPHVVRMNSDAVVDDADPHRPLMGLHPNGYKFVRAIRLIAGVLRIAYQIDQDLQDLVLVDANQRDIVVNLSAYGDAVAGKRSGVHAQTILDQGGHGHGLGDAAQLRVALLHGHRLLDMIDVVAQRTELLESEPLVSLQLLRELRQVSRQLPAALVRGQERSQIRLALLEQGRCPAEPRHFRILDALSHEARRDVDAGEDVADILEYVQYDFRHSREARGIEQLLVDALKLEIGFLAFGNVLGDGDRAETLAALGEELPRASERRSWPAAASCQDEFHIANGLATQCTRQRPIFVGHACHAVRQKNIDARRVPYRRIRIGVSRCADRKQIDGRRVAHEYVPVVVAGHDRKRDVSDHGLEQVFVLPQCLLHLLAVRNGPPSHEPKWRSCLCTSSASRASRSRSHRAKAARSRWRCVRSPLRA